MKSLSIITGILLLAFTSFAQDQSALLKMQFFQAFATNSIPLWEDGLAKLEKLNEAQADPAIQIQLAKAYYANASSHMEKMDSDKITPLLDKSQSVLDALLKANPNHAEAHALQSGVYGLRMALSPMKGMLLGGKSNRHLAKALEHGPENPLVHYFQASNLFYTPSMFGGDVDKALEHLEKSKNLYESQNNTQIWDYIGTLALLGQAYHKTKKLEEAKATYDLALAKAPNYGWIKYGLLPSLEKDMNKGK